MEERNCSSYFCRVGKLFLGSSFCFKEDYIEHEASRADALSVAEIPPPKGCIYTGPELKAFAEQKFTNQSGSVFIPPAEDVQDGFEDVPRLSEDRLPPPGPAR